MDALVGRAEVLPDRGWRQQEGGGVDLFVLRAPDDEIVHLYARRERGQALVEGLDAARVELPRLVEEVRRLRAQLDEQRARPAGPPEAKAQAPAQAQTPTRAEPAAVDDEGALSLAAPFRVGPREVRAAKDDPLAALSVQVARALSGDAKEVERARLIAMAFAASRGDMEAFWSARRMRTTPGAGKKKK